MAIPIRCPHEGCGHEFDADDSRHGRQIPCPGCGRLVTAAGTSAFSDRSGGGRVTISACAVLDNIRSLYNVGSIFRTSDAAGLGMLYLTGITGTPPRSEISKTALGADETVDWEYCQSALDAIEAARAEGCQVVAVETADDAVDYRSFGWRAPVCFVVGAEVAGVSPEAMAAVDAVVSLPMLGSKTSLNVSVAFGVIAYHLIGALGGAGA